ncbi:MAG TPA: pitrilysin family protein, partial [Thermoanaerobaculia bacterium]|nr:pitrilysin family protein [Thermoanaerobaculia bacterium]
MLKQRIACLAGLGLLALTAAPAQAADALKVTPPKLEVKEHQLANGLRVLLHEDHSVPVANVQIWYHVGSKDERQGRSGFAHLFEHIMFKGSANVPPEEHKNFLSSIGGRYNAGTDFDSTSYYQTIPSNYLERILWMEADRMRSLDVSEENFKSEREVVKEERRQRIENPPFGRLLEVVMDKTYSTHPYRILPIGSMADLDAATLQDVRDFHKTYYVPNNASMVIAGDFDPAQTLRWVEQYFGSIPKGKPIPRETPKEPAQTAERRAVDY